MSIWSDRKMEIDVTLQSLAIIARYESVPPFKPVPIRDPDDEHIAEAKRRFRDRISDTQKAYGIEPDSVRLIGDTTKAPNTD